MFANLDSQTTSALYRRFIWPVVTMTFLLAIGTVGFWMLSGRQASLFDGFYMTIITVSTIGFHEIIDLSDNVPGRIFTIFIALSGIGILTYLISQITAALIEGTLIESLKRKKMIKLIEKLEDHYIVCGIGNVGSNIVKELLTHDLACVFVEMNESSLEKALDKFEHPFYIKGDATEDSVLHGAGIEKAKGLFAALENDKDNLVLCFTARQLNPQLKIIANCRQVQNLEKLEKAGADEVVSPAFIGGFHMASEMIRPNVVSLMESIYNEGLNVEEISIPDQFIGKPLSDLNLVKYPETILIAVKNEENWQFNPSKKYLAQQGDILTFVNSGKNDDQLKKDLMRAFG
ncbi:MAG: NAD-binding protein [SAR324 cluster bacterium]|nr:NAD-binding protein [SAR324 cluster bacterium]